MADYLRTRRALGYKREGTERLLFAFVDYLEDHAADAVSLEEAGDGGPVERRERPEF